MVLDQFSVHPVAGQHNVHYGSHSQNKILFRMLTYSSLILILFILPEIRDFSKLKTVITAIMLRVTLTYRKRRLFGV